MISTRPRPFRQFALLLAVAAGGTALAPGASSATVVASALTLRAEGRAPIEDGRADTAFQRALDEAFRRSVLDALRGIAPERQSPLDLEAWQETVLARAGDFVGAWRILSQEQNDGFMTLEVEIELWGEKLARAALNTGAAKARAVRVVVFAWSLALGDRAGGEEVDVGAVAAAALEAELARRGAVIVSIVDRAPWKQLSGSASGESLVALTAAAARRVDANAAVIIHLTRRGAVLALTAELIAAASETMLVTARAEVNVSRDRPLAEALAPAIRQIAGACAPHLPAARSPLKQPPGPVVTP